MKDKLKVKEFLITLHLNYEISKDIEQKYIYFIKKKNTKQIEIKTCEGSTISLPTNYEFIKCEFYIQDQLIFSTNEIS